jgi:Xaa-Pro aminopeptidase
LDRLEAYMATGWTERPLEVSPVEQVGATPLGGRVSAVAGETLVIPTGYPPIRANDTEYRFRPGTDLSG